MASVKKGSFAKVFSADFETTTDAISSTETRVWLWGAQDVKLWENDEAVTIGYDIVSFLEWTASRDVPDQSIIFFHNLKFDGSFITNYLLSIGYEWVENITKHSPACSFSTTISDMGTWYQLQFTIGNSKTVTIRNSLCLLNNTVAEIAKGFNTRKRKLEMDYDEAKLDPEKVTEEDKEYLRCDVQVMSEVLNHLVNNFGLTRMTAASNAMHDFINRFGKKTFDEFFPKLSEDMDEWMRPGYKGGWCYVNPCHQEKRIREKGTVYDVNSLYPSMMHSCSGNVYPYGKPKWFDGEPKYDSSYPLWVAKVVVVMYLKDRRYPCVQVKGNPEYRSNEWLACIAHPTELTITSVDWGLIEDSYDIVSIKWLGGYKFHAKSGLFDRYIDYWYGIKRTTKGARKQLAKLMLNSFYGKFGSRLYGYSKTPYLDEFGVLRFSLSERQEQSAYYLPVAMFVTAYGRRFTITAANDNFSRFLYSDTDSIHMFGWEPPVGMPVDSGEMCCWDDETYFDDAIYLRQKTYMEHDSKTGEWLVKCAGMPKSIKYGIAVDEDGHKVKDANGEFVKVCNITPEQFHIGATWPSGKLLPKQVKGGVLLVDSPFQIRDIVCGSYRK